MYKIIVQNNNIINDCENITWNSNSDTLGTQLSFESIKNFPDGTVVSLFNDDRELFRGVVLRSEQKRWIYQYVCQDYSFYLKSKLIKQFNGISASDAIKSLLDEAYIKSEIVDIPTKITKIYKDNTLSDIIEDILNQAKDDQGVEYFKEIESNVLYVRAVKEMKIEPNILIEKDINITSSIENMKNKIVVTTNDEKNKNTLAIAEDTTEQWFYGVLSDIVSIDKKKIAQAQNIANNRLKESNKIRYNTSLELIAVTGGDDIKADRMIYLPIERFNYGYYKIKSASHTLSKGVHRVNINIEW